MISESFVLTTPTFPIDYTQSFISPDVFLSYNKRVKKLGVVIGESGLSKIITLQDNCTLHYSPFSRLQEISAGSMKSIAKTAIIVLKSTVRHF